MLFHILFVVIDIKEMNTFTYIGGMCLFIYLCTFSINVSLATCINKKKTDNRFMFYEQIRQLISVNLYRNITCNDVSM